VPATSQADKALAFRALHERPGAFIIPNPWDIGTARILARLGFEALATTSAGFAFSQGRRDYQVGREPMLEHAAHIVSATDLPVSADLENGFGDAAETAAETIRMAAAVGLVGGSIEDTTGRSDEPIYPIEFAAERVRAAADTGAALPFPFMLTARAENYLHGRPDLADTIRRLQAYQEAGANVLYAPGLTRKEEITAVVRSVDRPINLLMGMHSVGLTLAELSELGIKRVSLGSGLARLALGGFVQAATEMQEGGTFTFAGKAPSMAEISAFFDP
jgi:2-methylisocitrate lyase-like PEP mutase family enzyme